MKTWKLLVSGGSLASLLTMYGLFPTPPVGPSIQTREFGLSLEILGEELSGVSGSPGRVSISGPLTTDVASMPPDVQTTIQYPGDAQVVTRGQCALLCGAKDQIQGVSVSGVVAILATNAGGVFVNVGSEYSEGGSNFVGAAYSPATGQLFLLDAEKKRITKAAYAPGNTPPTSWQVVATDANFAPLGQMTNYRMRLELDGTEPKLALEPWQPSERLELEESAFGNVYHITVKAAGPVFETLPNPLNVHQHLTRIEGQELSVGQTSVTIRGLAAQSVNLLRVDGTETVLGSGVIGPLGTVTIPTLPLVSGGVYVAQVPAETQKSPPYLIPVKRFGASDALVDGLALSKFAANHAHEHFVNNSRFALVMDVDVVDESQVIVNKTYVCALTIGVETNIVTINGKQELLGPYLLWTDFTQTEDSGTAAIAVQLPIPNDPMLANSTFCYQFLVDVGGGIVKSSDVLCMTVRGGQFISPEAAPWFPPCVPTNGLLATPRRHTRASAAAFVKWMASCNAVDVERDRKARQFMVQRRKRR